MATTLHTSQTEASLRQELALVNVEYAELLAHVRAAVAAARDGELDPLVHLAGFLEERGQLPPDGVSASRLVAEAFARTAEVDRQFGGAL
ncbi:MULTISPECIES: hypothetical protein [Actinomadura]|uniref:Uncharacterized protein n=1 Tax=Actinomadura litoris TaxID=2678616 RepID=A0A7K1L2Q6_9ACTN|nr:MULTISPECIES: hypothetical protein [Actinomadura]MBT2208703.1 hypothetical protein [Actinomadura sp. NEAU-AAG7]MUN38728.1 hypothetical protein [Actinomadura litoris]